MQELKIEREINGVKIFGDIVLLKLFKQKNLRHMGDILEK
jgi:hypothetical protein